MSPFSDLDASPDVPGLLRYLDDHDVFLSAMKAYVAATARRAIPGGRILDLGCGVGHDLVRMADAGLRPVGLDSSRAALDRARQTGEPLVRGDASLLPFATDSLDGCRIERLLLHVSDPGGVLDEVLRVVRPGGLIAVFEPDFSTYRVRSAVVPDGSVPGGLIQVAHPNIGGQVAGMLTRRRCVVHDVVVEDSRTAQLSGLPQGAAYAVNQAAADGRLDPQLAQAWLAEQQERSATGTFSGRWSKVLVLAANRT